VEIGPCRIKALENHALHAAGFNDEEIAVWSAQTRTELTSDGFTESEIDDNFAQPKTPEASRPSWSIACALAAVKEGVAALKARLPAAEKAVRRADMSVDAR
jgi:hypothetical protein